MKKYLAPGNSSVSAPHFSGLRRISPLSAWPIGIIISLDTRSGDELVQLSTRLLDLTTRYRKSRYPRESTEICGGKSGACS